MAGSPTTEAGHTSASSTHGDEDQHRVALTRPFYIGLFEITQRQYRNVMETDSSEFVSDFYPVNNLSYETMRGGNWPTTDGPDANSFMGVLRAKCKAKNPDTGLYTDAIEGFDLPTEFQWEYACRAGTTGLYNRSEGIDRLARYGKDGSAGPVAVGSYLPNAWGLYDMHGNVWEKCRDWNVKNPVTLGQFVDPKGANSGTGRLSRGGGYTDTINLRSAARLLWDGASRDTGFRLSLTMP